MDQFTSEEEYALCNEAMDEYQTLCLNQSDDDDCNATLDDFESRNDDEYPEGGSVQKKAALSSMGRSFEFELFPHTDRRVRKFRVRR